MKIILAGVTVALASISLGTILSKCTKTETVVESVEEPNNKLDSIQHEIDTIYIKLKTVDQDYQKVVNSIIDDDPDSNYCFFIEYIGSQRERLDTTILSNKSNRFDVRESNIR